MGNHSDEESESEISESEIDVYSEKPYKLLKNGNYKVKVKDTFRCPFCVGKKKQNYKYKELFAHASGVAKGSSSRNAKQKANHFALAKYMENELAGDAEVPRPQNVSSSSKQSQADVDDIYVWPWMGIVINPVRKPDDKQFLLNPAYWLKRLARFNPLEVKTLWLEQDSVVAVIPKFNSGWSGFKSATELEKEYEIRGCSKKDWNAKRGDWKSMAYGWCARADDYNSQGLIAEYLSTVGKLKSFSDISKEENQNTNVMVEDLANRIAMTDENRNKAQYEYNVKAISLRNVVLETEKLDRAYKEETKRMQEISRHNINKILEVKERLSNVLESKMHNLKNWSKELAKREALTELERQKLEEDKKKIETMKSSHELASQEQEKRDDRVLKLMDEHQREKEEKLNKILQLQKELNSKQKLQMEIQELKGKMQVMRHVEDEDDEDVKKKMKEMNEELEEKCSELDDIMETNSALMVKERQSNDEIVEAREELTKELILNKLLNDRTLIRVKRVGELDDKPFEKACKQRFTNEEASLQQAILCSKWQENLKNSAWYPYKNVLTGDKIKEVVDEEDEQLRGLREEWGLEVMNAVKTALEELNEFNPSGRYSVPVLWHSKAGRKATLKEVINYMRQQIKFLKAKRT